MSCIGNIEVDNEHKEESWRTKEGPDVGKDVEVVGRIIDDLRKGGKGEEKIEGVIEEYEFFAAPTMIPILLLW